AKASAKYCAKQIQMDRNGCSTDHLERVQSQRRNMFISQCVDSKLRSDIRVEKRAVFGFRGLDDKEWRAQLRRLLKQPKDSVGFATAGNSRDKCMARKRVSAHSIGNLSVSTVLHDVADLNLRGVRSVPRRNVEIRCHGYGEAVGLAAREVDI